MLHTSEIASILSLYYTKQLNTRSGLKIVFFPVFFFQFISTLRLVDL